MKDKLKDRPINELDQLCISIRELVSDGLYKSCMKPICDAMEQNSHAPQPHNLMGIVLEKLGDHSAAMKHFRAAWALDPTYKPALHNLNTYATFFSRGKCAFDENDLPTEKDRKIEVFYNEQGIGIIGNNTTIEYDEHGIGHVFRR